MKPLSPFENDILVVLPQYHVFKAKEILAKEFVNNTIKKQQKIDEIKELKIPKWTKKQQKKIDKVKQIIRKINNDQEIICDLVSRMEEAERTQEKYISVL